MQQVTTDFGADDAFGRVPAKLEALQAWDARGTIQRTTRSIIPTVGMTKEAAREIRPGAAAARVIFIGEAGWISMVPVVEPSPDAEDKRQGQVLSWKEVRLTVVHPQRRVSLRCSEGILPA
ncbi:MAG: hypothetical protein IPL99_26225 [Candidatus Competibacteraceae bacterium]|nr:hypothetical protein [Candidatus Competibacteraceae bacterium]